MAWLRREDQEEQEDRTLCRWAARAREHGGRRAAEPPDPLRTAFQRDRDRILHSTAFRRLQYKTQVLATIEGDHFRSRMTHSLEVAQMARSVAIALRLNRHLAEAVALAHDLGHPPFGHAGEDTLDELMRSRGGFRHNVQGLRIVDYLEDRYGHGLGLNLVRTLRLSLLKGTIPDGFPLSEDLLPRQRTPLEARVVDLCDRTAYLCHDLDDGLRAGVLTLSDLPRLGLWQTARQRAGHDEPHRVISEITALLILDLVEANAPRLAEKAIDPPTLGRSEEMTAQSEELLAFLQTHFYRSELVLAEMAKGKKKISSLFERLATRPDALPDKIQARIENDGLARTVCDYVAGMTDRFLLAQ